MSAHPPIDPAAIQMPFTHPVDITEYVTAALNVNARKRDDTVQDLKAGFPAVTLAANGQSTR